MHSFENKNDFLCKIMEHQFYEMNEFFVCDLDT